MGCFSSKTKAIDPTPPYVASQIKKNFAMADDVAAKGYQGYEGDRIEGYNPTQQAAFDLGPMMQQFLNPAAAGDMSMAAAGAPALQYEGPRLIDDINGPGEAGGSIDDYMNPYIRNVIDTTMKDMQRQGEVQRLGINANATNAGGFGDARHGVAEGVQMRGEQENIGDMIARMMSGGYTEAMGLRNQDINRKADEFRTNAGQYDNMLARMMSGSALEGQEISNFDKLAESLFGLGESQRALGQQQKDIDYQDFKEERDYDKDLVSWLTSITAGQPAQKQIIEKSPSTASSIVGAAGGLASLFF